MPEGRTGPGASRYGNADSVVFDEELEGWVIAAMKPFTKEAKKVDEGVGVDESVTGEEGKDGMGGMSWRFQCHDEASCSVAVEVGEELELVKLDGRDGEEFDPKSTANIAVSFCAFRRYSASLPTTSATFAFPF
jgi:hypothetical protein